MTGSVTPAFPPVTRLHPQEDFMQGSAAGTGTRMSRNVAIFASRAAGAPDLGQRWRRGSLVLLAALVALNASSTTAAALTVEELACQGMAATQARVYFAAATRAYRTCGLAIAAGQLPAATDCGADSDVAAKLAAADTRLQTGLAAKCTDTLVDGVTFGEECHGVATLDELADCITASHGDRAAELGAIVIGDAAAIADPDARKCQKTSSAKAVALAVKRLALLDACRGKIAKGRLPSGTDCAATVAPLMAETRVKAVEVLATTCNNAMVVAIDPGGDCAAADTFDEFMACSLGAHANSVESLVATVWGASAFGRDASAELLTSAENCVGGPLSRCRTGDFLLQNDRIRVVVQSAQRNLQGVGQYGGNIIDADLRRAAGDPDRDNFEEWQFALNLENAAHYTDIVVLNDGSDAGPAIIRATGVDDLLDFVNPSSVVVNFGFPFPAAADDTNLPIEIVTDYILEPGANTVRVESTVQNLGATPLSLFLGEYINASGQVETFQPVYGFGEPLVTTACTASVTNACNWIAFAPYGEAEGVSYGWINESPGSTSFSTSGVTVPILGSQVVLALIGAAAQNFTLAAQGDAGDALTMRRWFVVGDGSVDAVVNARNRIQLLPQGTIQGTVTAGGSAADGARVSVYGAAGALSLAASSAHVITQARTAADGTFSLSIAPGTYDVVVDVPGHPYLGGGATPQATTVTVAADGTADVNIDLPSAATLTVNVTDETGTALPARVTIVGFDSSSEVVNAQTVLGLISNRTGVFRDRRDAPPHGIAAAHFLGVDGTSGPITIEPGSYRVVASHGLEYSIDTADVTLTTGGNTTLDLQVAPVIDTAGFISADFHVHSIDSPDSRVTRLERVVSMLGEGMDFFTPTDHDSRQDFNPAIASAGAVGMISVVPGAEMTTFDYGHFNAWPLDINPALVNGGSVDHGGAAPAGQDFPSSGNYSLTPAQIVAAAHADPGTDTVQINHFYSHFGLGDSGLAIDTGVEPPQSAVPGSVRRLDPAVANYFTDTFDALEILIDSNRSDIITNFFGRNLGDWFNLINQGIVRTAVANSDTHRVLGTLSGVPRTMVASATDDPGALAAIAETLSATVNEGRAIGTNGPMVRITTEASSTGQTGGLELGLPLEIATSDGAVDVTVEIQSPTWAPFDRVEFYVNPVTTRSSAQKQSGAGMVTLTSYAVTPTAVHNAGSQFNVSSVNVDPNVPGASRLEATTTLSLSGLTEDVWVVAIVRGTDGISAPLFPVLPFDLRTTGNTTLAHLTDGNLGEQGVPAVAYTNPLFIDVDGGGWTAPGVQVAP